MVTRHPEKTNDDRQPSNQRARHGWSLPHVGMGCSLFEAPLLEISGSAVEEEEIEIGASP